MAGHKVTITLDDDEIAQIDDLVSSGFATSVSSFVHRAVSTSLDPDATWAQILTQLLDETGGPLTADERRWAVSILTPETAI